MKELWCKLFHRDISLPIHGKYKCWRCLTEHDCGYDEGPVDPVPQAQPKPVDKTEVFEG